MNPLSIECVKCRVAATCPRQGSSPYIMKSGRKVLCTIIGGYGRTVVRKEILSPESLARTEKDGPCMTLAEVPTVDPDSGTLYKALTKIFHHPILHEREKTTFQQDMMYPKSHN